MEKVKEFFKKFKDKFIMLAIILGGVVLDQITKLIVDANMELWQSIPLIKGVLQLTYIRNRGAAFGILSEHRWVFMVISIVAIVAVSLYLFAFMKEKSWLLKIGLSLIVSGGIGNMIDRIAYGYVIDMIDFCLIDFAVFNVADSFVCVGAGLTALSLILAIIKEEKEKKKNKGDEEIPSEQNENNL